VEFHTHAFVLYQADEYTLALMEDECALHPMSDIEYIYQQLRAALDGEGRAKLAQRFAVKDVEGAGYLSYGPFQAALVEAGLELQDQALITIMRRHHAGDPSKAAVAYQQLLDAL
jgi:Ca2+-binding EF-hand superfamily protein